MKKNVLITLSLVLALLILASMAGCASGSTPAATATTATASSSSTGSTTSVAASSTTANLAPMTLTWMIPTQQKLPVTDSVVVKEIMKKFNVTFQVTELPPNDQYPQKKKLLIASQQIPDIMSWTTPQEANQYGPDGAFIDLTPYLDNKLSNLKALLDQDPGGKYNAFTPDGKLYMTPAYVFVTLPNFGFGYNKTEFDAVGATNVQTWDDFYNALVKLKQKYSNSYPLVGRAKEITSDSLKAFFIMGFTQGKANVSFPFVPGYDYDTNTYAPSVTMPSFKEAIQFLNKLYTEKLMDPEIFTNTMADVQNKLETKKGFVTVDYLGGLSGVAELQTKLNNGYYPMVTPFVTGQKQVIDFQPIKIQGIGTVLNGTLSGDKLDRALAILNYLYSPEERDLLFNNPDIIASTNNGQITYKDDVYAGTSDVADVYLPWSIVGCFQTSWQFQTKPGSNLAIYGQDVYLNPANASKFVPTRVLPFTPDQSKLNSDLAAKLQDNYESNIDLFVTGKKSFDQWDSFVSGMKQNEDQLVKLYNDVNQQFFK